MTRTTGAACTAVLTAGAELGAETLAACPHSKINIPRPSLLPLALWAAGKDRDPRPSIGTSPTGLLLGSPRIFKPGFLPSSFEGAWGKKAREKTDSGLDWWFRCHPLLRAHDKVNVISERHQPGQQQQRYFSMLFPRNTVHLESDVSVLFWMSSFLWIDLLGIIRTPCAHHEQFNKAGIYHTDVVFLFVCSFVFPPQFIYFLNTPCSTNQ